MGIVTDRLVEQISEQVERHRVVVWFDPDLHYAAVAERLSIQDVMILHYRSEKGFLSLRRELEPTWVDGQVPRVVIYAPLAEEDSHHALVEYTAVGAVLAPGRQPPDWNTRLAVVSRRALSGICPEATVAKIVDQIEEGKLTLEEIDELAEGCAEINVGVLKLIFGTGNPEEIMLRFLSDDSFDEDIKTKHADPQLAQLLGQALGTKFDPSIKLNRLRLKASRFLLINDFLDAIGGDVPEPLRTISRPSSKAALQTVQRLADAWRQRRDLAESYQDAAIGVEKALNLKGISWSLADIKHSETFLGVEVEIQSLVEDVMLKEPDPDLDRLVRERSGKYWAEQDPAIKLRWGLVANASEVLLLASHIERELKKRDFTAQMLVEVYTSGDAPWYALDTAHRHLERDYHLFDVDLSRHDSLIKLVAFARQRYAQIADLLAWAFVSAYQAAKFNITGLTYQTDAFRTQVEVALSDARVAYMLVDALRYEMACELIGLLGKDWRVEIKPALASVPTITEIGMAALMPGADQGLTVESAGLGKLAGVIGNTRLRNRKDRVKYLQNAVEGELTVTKLGQIAPLTDTKLQKKLSRSDLIVVTASDEIDGLWENDPTSARRLHEHVFSQLRRGIRTLFGLQVQKVIIVADHGYLFGEKLAVGELIDPPGGEEADLHRRVWVGKGGSEIDGCLRTPLSFFGIGGDLELVTPYGLSCFKVAGGSMEYFHGGLSLQELIVPILVVEPIGVQMEAAEPAFTWEVKFGSEKVTTRFFSVIIAGEAQMLFDEPPRVRLELRDGDKVISTPVSATYGFEESTRDVQMGFELDESRRIQTNTITLHISEMAESPSVTFYLLDAETGINLKQIKDIPFDIAY